MTNEQILLEFDAWMSRQKLSVSSRMAYQGDIKIFIKQYFSDRMIENQHLSKSLLEQFINYEKNSVSTRKRRYVSLRKFKEFNEQKQYFSIDSDFLVYSAISENSEVEIDLLTSEEIIQLLHLSPGSSLKESRDQAIFETLYVTGIRLKELCEIRLKDIDILLGYLTFQRNQSSVTIPIVPRFNRALIEYTNRLYQDVATTKESYLFLNRFGKQLSRQSIWKIISEYAKKIAPGKNITPYGLRKSFALHMVSHGASYEHISSVFGVKDVSFLLEQKKSTESGYQDFYKYHPENHQSKEREEV